MPNDQKLKPCPFCGGEALKCVSFIAPNMHWVLCKNCHAAPDVHATEAKAIAAWNTRHTPDREAVAKLLCEISDDDWKQGKRFWRCQADRVIALMEGKQ